MEIQTLTFSVCLKMIVMVNKIVKALQSSKDSALGQVTRIVKCSYRHLMLALTSNALRKLKANDKKPKMFKLELLDWPKSSFRIFCVMEKPKRTF